MTFSFFIDPADGQGVGVAFTDRFGGVSLPPFDSLNLGCSDADDPDCLAANFRIVSDLIGVGHIAVCSQVHGNHVVRVGEPGGAVSSFKVQDPRLAQGNAEEDQRGVVHQHGVADGLVTECGIADALVTAQGGVALAIQWADCVPVLFADPEARIVAAAHAGRVGLLSGVVESTVASMRTLGASDIHAWIGPHICPACYEVPDDMAASAWKQIPATRAVSCDGTSAIDLGAGVESILESRSISVTRCDPCTSCDPHFFSYRRDQGQTGRHAALIWLAGFPFPEFC